MIGFRLFRSQMPSLLLYALFPRVKQKELTSFTIGCEVYYGLRESVGWHNFSKEQTERALANSLYTVTAFNENQAVGMGRLIGDGMYFMIADLVVHPDFQKKGIGGAIMDLLIGYVRRETPVEGRSSIQLIAEPGKEAFYEKRGFKRIPHEFCGSGMRKVIRRGTVKD